MGSHKIAGSEVILRGRHKQPDKFLLGVSSQSHVIDGRISNYVLRLNKFPQGIALYSMISMIDICSI